MAQMVDALGHRRAVTARVPTSFREEGEMAEARQTPRNGHAQDRTVL